MQREPVAISALVRAGGYVAAAYGFEMTEEQLLALVVVVEMVVSFIVRARVTPV